MPAKKIRPAPVVALLSDTALISASPLAAPAETEGDFASGLNRTLARRREELDAPAPTRASALAKLAKAEKPAKSMRSTAKKIIGPRSGHK
jgi:hypothetical protein